MEDRDIHSSHLEKHGLEDVLVPCPVSLKPLNVMLRKSRCQSLRLDVRKQLVG